MDNYAIGDEINVHFNLSGRLWSGNGKPEKCFTSLQAWKIDSINAGMNQDGPPMASYDEPGFMPQSNDNFDDDIPF